MRCFVALAVAMRVRLASALGLAIGAMQLAGQRNTWQAMRSIRVMAVTAAALLAACQHPPAARPFDDYGSRLRVLIGQRFGFTMDSSHAVQEATGPFMLVAVGVDYAEFRMDHGQVLFVSLGTLRVTVRPRSS